MRIRAERVAVLTLVLVLAIGIGPRVAVIADKHEFGHDETISCLGANGKQLFQSALAGLQAANRALHGQIADMHSAAYLVRQAREQLQLVPAGLQAFVVKGPPQNTPNPAPTRAAAPAPPRLSLVHV